MNKEINVQSHIYRYIMDTRRVKSVIPRVSAPPKLENPSICNIQPMVQGYCGMYNPIYEHYNYQQQIGCTLANANELMKGQCAKLNCLSEQLNKIRTDLNSLSKI
jgi:hypothetical protein